MKKILETWKEMLRLLQIMRLMGKKIMTSTFLVLTIPNEQYYGIIKRILYFGFHCIALGSCSGVQPMKTETGRGPLKKKRLVIGEELEMKIKDLYEKYVALINLLYSEKPMFVSFFFLH